MGEAQSENRGRPARRRQAHSRLAVTRAVGTVEGSSGSAISLLAFGGAYGLVALNLVLFLVRADRRVVHDLVAGTHVGTGR